MILRMNDAVDNAQMKPAGINLPDFDQRMYIIAANVNDAPAHHGYRDNHKNR